MLITAAGTARRLEPGSKLFVYTDGVPETSNGDQELFGTQRLLER